nr:unnamed protein product [Digitaria exilis]
MPAPGSGGADVDNPSSASAILAGAVTGHHILHIEGYSRTKEELPHGEGIKSRPFRVGGCSWCIWYYPNGDHSEYADCITIFLDLEESDTRPVKARAKFSLLDRAGKPVPSHSKYADLHEYAVRGDGWGLYDFITREFLEKSGHLQDDCFKIRCDVIIPKKLCTEDRAATPAFFDVSASDIFRQLGDLLSSKDGADVMFQIDDMLPQAFEALLDFIYTDSLPEMEGQEEAMMAQHLLEAADRSHFSRVLLENSGHLKDDCFKIRCDVIIPKILYTKDRAATPSFFDVPASDIFRQLGDLLRSKDGADVMFQVAGKTFWAHRFILGARSPVFKDELLGAMRERALQQGITYSHTD